MFASGYYPLLFLRFIVGVGVGGLSVPFDILAEFMSAGNRGRGLICIEYFWAAGTLFVNGVAWSALDSLGWRYVVGFSTIPVVLGLAAFVWLPESPQWLLSQRRGGDALDVLRRCAALNGRPNVLPDGTTLTRLSELEDLQFEPSEDGIAVDSLDAVAVVRQQGFRRASEAWIAAKARHKAPSTVEASSISPVRYYCPTNLPLCDVRLGGHWNANRRRMYGHLYQAPRARSSSSPRARSSSSVQQAVLFGPTLRRTTILCWIIWFTAYFAYYGLILILPEVLGRGSNATSSTPEGACCTPDLELRAVSRFRFSCVTRSSKENSLFNRASLDRFFFAARRVHRQVT